MTRRSIRRLLPPEPVARRVVSLLASLPPGAALSAREIARRVDSSPSYVATALRPLRGRGIVREGSGFGARWRLPCR